MWFWFTVLKSSDFSSFAKLTSSLYLLLHFVPSKKALFISAFKVFLSFNFYRKSCDFPWRTWVGTLFPAVRFRPGVSFPDEDRCVQGCFKAGLAMTGVRQRQKIGFRRILLTSFTYQVDKLLYHLWQIIISGYSNTFHTTFFLCHCVIH